MKWSYRITRISGIDVYLHVTFLLLLAFFAFQGYASGGPTGAILKTLFVSLLFLCVLLHEFGHAFAARYYGIRTPDITLLPIGGVARLERMPENPVQELVIAIAGPLVNVAIALGLWLLLGLPAALGNLDITGSLTEGIASQLLQVNIMLVAFNLIPAFPMDGGRVLRALLALKLGHATGTKIAARVGQFMAVLLGLAGVFGVPGLVSPSLFLVFIAMFVFSGAQQEAAYARMRAAVGGLTVGDAMITRFQTLFRDMDVASALREVHQDSQPVYAVTDHHLRAAGLVSRNELLAASSGTVGDIATTVPSVSATASFDEAFSLMQQCGSGVLPVVNPAGQIVGLISLNRLRERASARA